MRFKAYSWSGIKSGEESGWKQRKPPIILHWKYNFSLRASGGTGLGSNGEMTGTWKDIWGYVTARSMGVRPGWTFVLTS
jgi:hypothetical protein